MSQLRFEDRVAVVTGAGNGLGRSHALTLAARGAKVVVNDLGGSHTGEGASQNAADKVVAEIKEAGGEAVANYDSVVEGDKVIQTAMDTWGRVDIVVNNAGILRDVSFAKMTQQDWDLVYQVHVLGAFKVTHAAWPHMREAQYGRIVNTASAAGIYGNFGQVNYAMAKLGLVGFTNSLAIEGRRRNIFANTIAPIAGSRMTETVLPPELVAALEPQYVSPLVAWLCHEDCEHNGGLFEVGGGFFAELRWERSTGKMFRLGRDVSIEDVQRNFTAITSFAETTHPDTVMVSMQPIMANVEAGPSKGGNKYIDVDEALGYEFPETTSRYDERDLAIYALGVGAATEPTDDKDLQLVYEMHGGGMKALPTYGVVPAVNAILELAKSGHQAPGMNYGLDRLLHGEQYTEVLRPLPTEAKLTHKARIKDIFDKGKHALVVTEVRTFDDNGDLLVKNEVTSLIRGAGGWGGERGPSADVNTPPERKPDASVEEVVPENQALLYRLSGDWNPLHADPGFASAMGFEKPILHGLCTFGYAGRHVIQSFAKDGNPDYFKSIQVRFADSVFPGETLITEMWKESDTRIVFQTRVKERDSVVISNAAIELYEEIPKPKAKAKKADKAAPAQPAGPTTTDLFNAVGAFLAENPDTVAKIGTVYQFKLSDPASIWTLDIKDTGKVSRGDSPSPQCTLELSDADFLAMATGKADPMKLFTSGKLKISGDIMASQKLSFLQQIKPEMVKAEIDKRLAAGGGAESGGDDSGEFEPTTWDVFMAIRDYVGKNKDLAEKIQTVYLFKVSNPDSHWTLDLKRGVVEEGETVKPDCTLEIAEADFLDMTSGKANPMKLFTTGKLKISGNIMASQKLEFLQKMDPEDAKAAALAARKEHGGPQAAQVVESVKAEPKAPAIFDKLSARLTEHPELSGEVQAVVRFAISEPEGVWTVDLSSDSPTVSSGEVGEANTTLALADEDLTALASGEASAQDLYQRGKLRVDGDITVAHRLGFLKGLA